MNGWTTMLRSQGDRVAGWILVVLGAVAVVLAFLGVADSAYMSDQLAYIASGGLGGLILVAVGVGLLISADLHDEWRKLDRIEATIRGDALPSAAEIVLDPPAQASNGDGSGAGHSGAPLARSISLMQLVSLPPASWATLALDWHALRAGLARSGAVVAVAAIVVGAGWWRAAETTDLNTAVSGTGLAAAGVFIAVVAVAAYLLWLRGRLAGRKSDLLGDWLLEGMAAERRDRRTAARIQEFGRPSGPAGTVLVLDGGQRYHRAGCAALVSQDPRAVAVESLDAALEPCGLCLAAD
jgi:hypothetical protein